MARSKSISGGCLCGAIRFTIAFPNEGDWPPKGNGICQCTMCRKHSGSLLPQNIGFPRAHVSQPLESNATFKTYKSSESASRGFYSTCGSPLTFIDTKVKDIYEINAGAIDEDVLVGKRDEANAWEDEYGRHVPRIGGIGKELCYPAYHIFMDNEIAGLTDGFPGTKFLQSRDCGKPFTGNTRDMKRRT
ncbi:hypothetical protein P154DRAFT_450759 [Amniculicola lignicola CBS 123094]|uniref:CENP-V/GFA domain-containing protein n=1 Tax=Amniculicola lignicola CBS 123094 TaxID=1392246 RepID=A0A6A5VWJ8_9PLEO|nr:hypothetical protein P154DRAFT_450759 [Amniculicola lignicola CBS 123094]